jgi:hypothetical protein
MEALSRAEILRKAIAQKSKPFEEGDKQFFASHPRRKFRVRAISPFEKEACRGAGLSTAAPAGWGCYTAIWKLSSEDVYRAVFMCPALPVCEATERAAERWFFAATFAMPSQLRSAL